MAESPSILETVQRDELMLARAKADPQGVAEIYDAYADKLYGFLLKRCGNRELAEDLVSKSFMRFIESLPEIEWQGVSLGAWLFRVATNALTDHWRSAKNRLDVELDTEEWDPPSQTDNPTWYAELNMERDKLLEAMKDLADRDQQVLDLRFFGQLEITEIAEQLKISANHASVLVYRAIGRLRTHYIKLYGGSS